MHEPRWSRVSPAELLSAVAGHTAPEYSDRGRGGAPGPEEPVYAQLVREWQQGGRMLPGQRDREWVELVLRRAW